MLTIASHRLFHYTKVCVEINNSGKSCFLSYDSKSYCMLCNAMRSMWEVFRGHVNVKSFLGKLSEALENFHLAIYMAS